MNNLNKLRGYRSQLGFTQEYMASLLGITQSTYSAKERGERLFNQKEIEVIVRKFKEKLPNVTIEDIFF